ncbi:MAG: sensor histidine kinase, partial [Ginsengibacter sp.]
SPSADKVIITTAFKDGHITLCVQDFGIGIAADKQANIFEQFYRVSGTLQDTFPGLGLGMFIASEIITRSHGTMSLESIEGKGSTFCFTLPVSK